MAKTETTRMLEEKLMNTIKHMGIFGCLEVTIGWLGKEIVDCLSYDYDGIFRCYEIKVSKSDFNSKAHKTFVGHYNYYVMPKELYEQLQDKIPKRIGVYVYDETHWNKKVLTNVKKATKQELKVKKDILKDSLIRSMFREMCKK
jgi:hypothetical protein